MADLYMSHTHHPGAASKPSSLLQYPFAPCTTSFNASGCLYKVGLINPRGPFPTRSLSSTWKVYKEEVSKFALYREKGRGRKREERDTILLNSAAYIPKGKRSVYVSNKRHVNVLHHGADAPLWILTTIGEEALVPNVGE